MWTGEVRASIHLEFDFQVDELYGAESKEDAEEMIRNEVFELIASGDLLFGAEIEVEAVDNAEV